MLTAANELLEGYRAGLADAQIKAARAAAAVESAGGRRARAVGQIAGLEDPEAVRSGLSTEVRELTIGLTEAAKQREEIAAMAPDLEAARAALERARSIVDRAERDGQRIRIALGKLDTMIDLLAGEAVEEELSDVIMRADDAERALDELKFEVAVLLEARGGLARALVPPHETAMSSRF